MNYRTFKPKFSISSQKYGVGIQDPRSVIRKKPIPDPGSRNQKGTVSHALSLPPPGIELGLHASKAGTLPKELSRQLIPVLQIRDVYPRSRILIFSHPGCRIPDAGSRIPDPKTATKERGEKKFVVITFYVAKNFTKLQIISVLNC